MRAYTLDHVGNHDLDQGTIAAVSGESASIATLLVHLAESDVRRRYAPAGYSSMLAYCVGKLGMAEDSALKRIRAARVARQFPSIFEALSAGRLHLTAVLLLKPHLRPENAEFLLAAAERKSKAEIEQILAERFPRSEMFAWVEGTPSDSGATEVAPEPLQKPLEVAPEPPATRAIRSQVSRAKLAPLAPGRFALQVCLGEATRRKLQRIQELLRHKVPTGDLAEILDRTFDVALRQFEKEKFAATDKPRRRRPSRNSRTIPAQVRRAVWERDGGCCTFVGEDGHRCEARGLVEFDHKNPVARGGEAAVENVRLLCRTHNQLEAERTFGAGFMDKKREEAKQRRERNSAAGQDAAASEPAVRVAMSARSRDSEPDSALSEQMKDLTVCLRNLGFRVDQARRAVEHCLTIPDATLEEHVRFALRVLCPKTPAPQSCGSHLEDAAGLHNAADRGQIAFVAAGHE